MTYMIKNTTKLQNELTASVEKLTIVLKDNYMQALKDADAALVIATKDADDAREDEFKIEAAFLLEAKKAATGKWWRGVAVMILRDDITSVDEMVDQKYRKLVRDRNYFETDVVPKLEVVRRLRLDKMSLHGIYQNNCKNVDALTTILSRIVCMPDIDMMIFSEAEMINFRGKA